MTNSSTNSQRVLSGMRPTGKLHLGNYVGALANWVKLQEKYDCYFFVADWHALTTDYADPTKILNYSIEVAKDWLAAGLDPAKCTLFIQSHVHQHAELHLLFSMITPLGWLERVPTYKDQQQQLKDKDLNTYGFLGYPLLQAADILIYRKSADLSIEDRQLFVPVGEDQVAHVELTREVARRANLLYKHTRLYDATYAAALDKAAIKLGLAPDKGDLHPLFVEPQVILTNTPRLRGMDGRKMSKSFDNAIYLSDPSSMVEEKIGKYTTNRSTVQDPGNPEECPLGDVIQSFTDQNHMAWAFQGCRSASISCAECKARTAMELNKWLTPIQERQALYSNDSRLIWNILQAGAEKAAKVAELTIQETRKAMGVSQSTDSLLNADIFSIRNSSSLFLPYEETQSIVDIDERGNKRREAWLKYVTLDFPLRATDIRRVYTTIKNKRVCIVTAGEQRKANYILRPRDRSYEVLVFVLHRFSGELVDFIIPSKLYQPFWKKLERENKAVRIIVKEKDGKYFWLAPDEMESNLDEYKSRYEYLG